MAKVKRTKVSKGRHPAPKDTPAITTHLPIYSNEAEKNSCHLEDGFNPLQICDLSLEDTPGKPTNVNPLDAPFRFLDLPSELRLRVYSYTFEGIVRAIDVSSDNKKLISGKMYILRTCKQIYQEASHHFYASHTFRIFPTDPRRFNKSKKSIIARLKSHQRASLTSLELRVGPGWSRPPRSWVVNKRLKLDECTNVRLLCVMVECDPSHPMFNGFRRSDGFYEDFCKQLLNDVLKELPSIDRVQFDAWIGVKKSGGMMQGLIETTTENHKRITWGPEKGWTDADEDDDINDLARKTARSAENKETINVSITT